MKESIKSTPYFSAYSLKELNLPSGESDKKNHNKQFSRVMNRLKIFPVANSYSKRTSINKINIPAAVQPSDKNWFINYE
ncbi:MAG: hypothetical protein ACHQF0_08055 [Chitinophagales bacterium]